MRALRLDNGGQGWSNTVMANQSHDRGEPPNLDNGSLPSREPVGEPKCALRLCGVCGGSGNLLSTRYGLKWWPCPCCGGAGVEAMRQAPLMFRPKRGCSLTPAHQPALEVQNG